MANNEEHETEAMMVDDGDSGRGSTDESGSRRDSLSSMASANSSATSSNDSAVESMFDRRSSLSSNASSMSVMSDRSLSAWSGQSSDAGYPDSNSSSRRSSLSSVRSDDSTTTIRSDATATSMRSDQTRTSAGFNQDDSKSTRDIDSTSGHTRVRTPYNHRSCTTNTTTTTPRSDPTIEIMVVDFSCKTHIVRVRPTDTVQDLKCKIKDKVGVAPIQQQLTFQGRPLTNDASTVTSCGLENSSIVHLLGRMLGGKDNMHRVGFV
ncbi:papilin-like [Lytechinus variegatus]|uniref:papilin-like n=1 Tax=Lytechinus variegatus TaxID=7654 RepID=UPI001BB1F46D|nr:papilin-like [Lytechinus variegatus]